MIEINLLPEELRAKIKIKAPEQQAAVKVAAGFNQDQLFIYAIPALLGLFVLIHLFFAVKAVSKNSKLVSLNNRWIEMAPQKKVFDEFNKEFSSSSLDTTVTQGLIRQRIPWAQKLNKLSLNLPTGVWFNDISVNAKNIIIQGSVVSLEKDEVGLINKLLDSLKMDTEFSKDFPVFELSSVEKRSIGGYDIADFVLTGVLRTR